MPSLEDRLTGEVRYGANREMPQWIELREFMARTLIPELQALRQCGALDLARLRIALIAVGDEARAQGIIAERLVMLIQELWDLIPTTEDVPWYTSSTNGRKQMIAMTLDAYYLNAGPPEHESDFAETTR
jgi:hypothetical protein